jgi:hypothetical protein
VGDTGAHHGAQDSIGSDPPWGASVRILALAGRQHCIPRGARIEPGPQEKYVLCRKSHRNNNLLELSLSLALLSLSLRPCPSVLQ